MTDQANTTLPQATHTELSDAESWFAAETSTFGDRLAGAREAAGMSQAQLARRLGVKLTTISKWENDLSEPRANRLQLLSGLLGVSLTWLLMAEGDGLDAPIDSQIAGEEANELLSELAQLRGDLRATSERVAKIEGRVRQIVRRS